MRTFLLLLVVFFVWSIAVDVNNLTQPPDMECEIVSMD